MTTRIAPGAAAPTVRGATGTPARALIVEDRRLLAESLQSVLEGAGIGTDIVSSPSVAAVDEAVAESQPTVALVAVGIGSGDLTEQVIGRMCERGIPVVVMTGGTDRLRLARCVEEGAIAVLDKSMDVATLLQLVRDAGTAHTVLQRTERYRLDDELRRHRASLLAERRPLEYLTKREREVLRQLTQGLRAGEIAARACVSICTIRSQIKSILSKLGVGSQIQAVALATRSHWFGSDN